MIAVVAAFNQEKALVGAFSVIAQPVVEPMDRFTALEQIMFYAESYGYYDLRLAFGARTFIESFDFLKRKRRDQKVRTCSVGILNYVEFIIFLSVKVRES